MLMLGKRRGIGRTAAKGLSEAKALCLEVEHALTVATQNRVAEMARVTREIRDGWPDELENGFAFIKEVTCALEAVRKVRGRVPGPAAMGMRFQASTIFLQECHRYLASDPQGRERMILVSGLVTPDGLRILSRMEEVVASKQSAAYVEADGASTHKQLVRLTERAGHDLLGMFHSHMTTGAESTRPSNIDLANQGRFAAIGWEALAGIFSLDGYVRVFSTVSDFGFSLYGKGAQIVSDEPREKVIKLDIEGA
jgi:hypothetical protein